MEGRGAADEGAGVAHDPGFNYKALLALVVFDCSLLCANVTLYNGLRGKMAARAAPTCASM